MFDRSLSTEHQIINGHEPLPESNLMSANSSNTNEEDDVKRNVKSTRGRKNKPLGSSKKIEVDFETNGSTKQELKDNEDLVDRNEQVCPKRRKNR